MGIFSHTPKVGGKIGHFGLGDWWLATFTPAERDYIEEKHSPMGGLPDVTLTQGNIGGTSQTAAGLLVGLSSWFVGPGDRHLALRILEKAEAEAEAGSDILDRYFVYSQMVKVYYAERETRPGAFEAAITACEKQIAVGPQAFAAFRSKYGEAPPSMLGFTQLAIIREKQGDYAEALRVCHEAERQGWRDGKADWSKRIARIEKRAAKA